MAEEQRKTHIYTHELITHLVTVVFVFLTRLQLQRLCCSSSSTRLTTLIARKKKWPPVTAATSIHWCVGLSAFLVSSTTAANNNSGYAHFKNYYSRVISNLRYLSCDINFIKCHTIKSVGKNKVKGNYYEWLDTTFRVQNDTANWSIC